MKTRTKILSAMALALACGVVGGVSSLQYKAEAQVNALDGFTTPGASIYLNTVENSQMRFVFNLDNDEYEDGAKLKENVTTGVIYMPYDIYLKTGSSDLSAFTLDTAGRASEETTSNWISNENGGLTTYAYVQASETVAFNRIMIARAYLTDGETTYYTDTAKASMAYVAWQNYDAYKDTYQDALDTYRSSYTLTYDGAEVFKGAYGEAVVLSDATKAGYTFGGWYWDSEYTNAVVEGDYITGNHKVYAKFTGSTISASGLGLTNATVTLTGTETKTLTGVTDSFSFDVPHGSYSVTINDGENGNYFYNGTFAVEGEKALTLSDFVKDPINMSMGYESWSEATEYAKFTRTAYDTTNGVAYTVANPEVPDVGNTNTGKYTVAPAAMPATSEFTASYDVTVNNGGPIMVGVSIGNGKDVWGEFKPNYHVYFVVDANGNGLHSIYSSEYATNTYKSVSLLSVPYVSIGTSFNLKVVRENAVVAFFVNDTMVGYLDVDVQNLINGYTLGNKAMHYGISVRSGASGTGTATFTNISFANEADLSDYFATVTGSVSEAPSSSVLFQNKASVTNGGYTTRNDGDGIGAYINWNSAAYGYSTDASGNFSAYLPRANYIVETFVGDTPYTGSVSTSDVSSDSVAASMAAQNNDAYVGSVTLNGTTLRSTIAYLPNSNNAVSVNGTYGTIGGKCDPLHWYYMSNSKTTEDFTYVVDMSAGAFWGAFGASIYTASAKISAFATTGGELWIDIQYNSAWYHDFKVDISGVTGYTLLNGLGTTQKGVNLKYVKTSDSIELYSACKDANGVAGYYLVLTMKNDGSIVCNNGVSIASANATDEKSKTAIKSFFVDGAEMACGFFSNSKWGNPTPTAHFYPNDIAYIGAAKINGAWAGSANPADDTYSVDGSTVTFTGVGGSSFYSLANVVGENYTFETTLTAASAADMIGVGITNGTNSISFQFMPWESANVLVVAAGHNGVGKHFFINSVCGNNGSYIVSGAVNVKVALIKTASSLTLKINDAEIATFNADGSLTTTYGTRKDNALPTDTATMEIIAAVVSSKETGCGYKSNNFTQNITCAVSFQEN